MCVTRHIYCMERYTQGKMGETFLEAFHPFAVLCRKPRVQNVKNQGFPLGAGDAYPPQHDQKPADELVIADECRGYPLLRNRRLLLTFRRRLVRIGSGCIHDASYDTLPHPCRQDFSLLFRLIFLLFQPFCLTLPQPSSGSLRTAIGSNAVRTEGKLGSRGWKGRG